MENFRERRRGPHSDISLFAPRRDFSSSPPFLYPADLRATRARTSQVVIWKKKIRSRGRRVAPWFTTNGKKWIISHLSFASSLSNFYPFDFTHEVLVECNTSIDSSPILSPTILHGAIVFRFVNRLTCSIRTIGPSLFRSTNL